MHELYDAINDTFRRGGNVIIGGLSAHADNKKLAEWQTHTGNPEVTFLVHGEPDAMQALKGNLKSQRIEMPQLHPVFAI